MERRVVFSRNRRAIAAGVKLAPTVIPAASRIQGDCLVTLTVDDPTADPPTDAKCRLDIEASDDGLTWAPISTFWGGTSGVMSAVVPARGRLIRVSGVADMAAVVDISVEV